MIFMKISNKVLSEMVVFTEGYVTTQEVKKKKKKKNIYILRWNGRYQRKINRKQSLV